MADDEQKAKQKAEAAAAKEAKEREKFIAKIVKEGGAPACPNGSLIPFALCCALQDPLVPPLRALRCSLR